MNTVTMSDQELITRTNGKRYVETDVLFTVIISHFEKPEVKINVSAPSKAEAKQIAHAVALRLEAFEQGRYWVTLVTDGSAEDYVALSEERKEKKIAEARVKLESKIIAAAKIASEKINKANAELEAARNKALAEFSYSQSLEKRLHNARVARIK